MFLLILHKLYHCLVFGLHLHSNMFLLILVPDICWIILKSNLHSNMFLLILFSSLHPIKSLLYLHSNMFLLILIRHLCQNSALVFTFQYVSINTQKSALCPQPLKYLHSNMFLLIPVSHTCLYFNTLQYHFCLPKQLSTYSFTISLRTAVSALIFRTVDLYYFLHYYKSTITT